MGGWPYPSGHIKKLRVHPTTTESLSIHHPVLMLVYFWIAFHFASDIYNAAMPKTKVSFHLL